MGTFLFRWPHPDASDVHVTGTFDDWSKSESLNKVGDIWEKEVHLATKDKVLYKFVVNDNWVIDPLAPQEDDGHGNVNNVLYPDQIKSVAETAPGAVTTSSAAPGSTTAALAGAVPLEPKKAATEVTPATEPTLSKETTKSSLPGAFPETPLNEPDSFSVNPIPATAGPGNPVDLPAGEKVPPPGDVTSNTIHSAVTTSQEDYEKTGSQLPFIGGALAGVAAALGAAEAAFSSDKKENLIPESSLPMGPGAGTALAGTEPTVSSVGPTSTTAALAGQVPLEEPKAATVIDPQSTSSTVPEVVKESIAEAHTDPEATTSAEAVKEKAEVEQELLKRVPTSEETGEPAPAIAAAAAATNAQKTTDVVPEVVKESIAEAHTDPEATTSAEAVKEKAEVEQELLKRVPTSEESGEPAPTIAAATAETAPAPTTGASSGTVPDPSLADEPAVRMMNQNEAETSAPATEAAPAAAAPADTPAATETSKVEAASAAAPTSKEPAAAASSTPTKKPAEPSSASPATPNEKKKKKHRISAFFNKILN